MIAVCSPGCQGQKLKMHPGSEFPSHFCPADVFSELPLAAGNQQHLMVAEEDQILREGRKLCGSTWNNEVAWCLIFYLFI